MACPRPDTPHPSDPKMAGANFHVLETSVPPDKKTEWNYCCAREISTPIGSPEVNPP